MDADDVHEIMSSPYCYTSKRDLVGNIIYPYSYVSYAADTDDSEIQIGQVIHVSKHTVLIQRVDPVFKLPNQCSSIIRQLSEVVVFGEY
jgi:hypothetical protein